MGVDHDRVAVVMRSVVDIRSPSEIVTFTTMTAIDILLIQSVPSHLHLLAFDFNLRKHQTTNTAPDCTAILWCCFPRTKLGRAVWFNTKPHMRFGILKIT